MDKDKIFEFEGTIKESTLPSRIRPADIHKCFYYIKNISNEQFDQIRVTFEIDLIPFSTPENPRVCRFIFEKEYAIIEKGLSKDIIRKLLYESILDAYEIFKTKFLELNVTYIDKNCIRIRDFEDECQHFEMERF